MSGQWSGKALRDVVLVGHDFAGSLIAQAARQLTNPPKRLVMLAGIVPPPQRSMLAVLPTRSRAAYRLLDVMSKMSRRDLRLPRYVIGSYLCNGMSPMELVEVMGFFGPLPVKVITSRVPAEEDPLPCPVTYVTLSQDRLVPPEIQLRMAHGIPDVEIVTVNSCHEAMLKSPRSRWPIFWAVTPDSLASGPYERAERYSLSPKTPDIKGSQARKTPGNSRGSNFANGTRLSGPRSRGHGRDRGHGLPALPPLQ